MNEIPVPRVPASDQQRVGRRLAASRSTIDHAVGALTRQIELLREHRQALITAAVTGELEVPGVAT